MCDSLQRTGLLVLAAHNASDVFLKIGELTKNGGLDYVWIICNFHGLCYDFSTTSQPCLSEVPCMSLNPSLEFD